MAGRGSTVAKNALKILNRKIGFETQLPVRRQFFKRAIKVFIKSFLAYRTINTEVYNNKYNEFFNTMQTLYQLHEPLPEDMLDRILEEVLFEQTRVSIAVHKYRAEEGVNAAEIVVNTAIAEKHFNLNPRQEMQTNIEFGFTTSSGNYSQWVNGEQEIHIQYRERLANENQWLAFEPFRLRYRHIHCEGFEQWIRFGNNRLLVSIRFEAFEPNINPDSPKIFHFTSFYHMIQRRLEHYRQLPNPGTHTHFPFHDKALSYMRGRVDPQTMEAYWGLPINAGYPEPEFVQYMDLQIGFTRIDEMVGQFCICNEFCNLNAFFYHNPIYRFLMVEHNWLYIKNRTNMADIYQFVLAICLTKVKIPNSPYVLKTPLIRLLGSAHNQWIQKTMSKKLVKKYYSSYPKPMKLLGITYNTLRYSVPIYDILIETEMIDSFDQIMNKICIFYRILLRLHHIIGRIPQYVATTDRDIWNKELEHIGRDHIHQFVVWSLREILSGFDDLINLFDDDFEYSIQNANTDQEIEYIEARNQIFRLRSAPEGNGNLFNAQFLCQPYILAIERIWKYITRHEPNLIQSTETMALKGIRNFCVNLLVGIVMITYGPHLKTAEFVPYLQSIKVQFCLFFKLKLYFYAFGIQNHFIDSALNLSQSQSAERDHIFIFRYNFPYQWIEDIFAKEGPNHTIIIYRSNETLIRLRFDIFYNNCIGRAEHEFDPLGTSQPFQPLPPDRVIASVNREYIQTIHWHRNNGNNRKTFTLIIDVFINSLLDIVNSSQSILQTYIASHTVEELMIQFNPESGKYMIEELVYWLVSATCFMVTREVLSFLIKIYKLEKEELVANHMMYVLCKPGLVPLFQTRKSVMDLLIAFEYQVKMFDNCFERISNIFKRTRLRIRQIYTELYKRFAFSWLDEIRHLYDNDYQNSGRTMRLHLISGLSFVFAFDHIFHKYVNIVRNGLEEILAQNRNQTQSQQSFNQIYIQCQQWLNEVDRNELSAPFAHPFWDQIVQDDFTANQQLIDFMDENVIRADTVYNTWTKSD